MRMHKMIYALSGLLILFSPSLLMAQTETSPLDRYLEKSKTILVVKCLSVGPVNILMRSNIRLQVLHVVKGKETLREITANSQFSMRVGDLYLISSKDEAGPEGNYIAIDSRDSVIPVSGIDEANKLKTLSPRIVVLRTMNVRIDALESEIRTRTYELEALKAVKGSD
jgi:hypothetical protein